MTPTPDTGKDQPDEPPVTDQPPVAHCDSIGCPGSPTPPTQTPNPDPNNPTPTTITQNTDINIKIIINNILHKSGGGHSSSHKLNGACFDAIKIAWFGKVHRGQNSAVDSFIDKCLA
jgi:hypothetical protein